MNQSQDPNSGATAAADRFGANGQASEVDQTSRVGTLLCATRMRLSKDLQDIASVLHIRYNFLVAIEDGRYEDLPGQAYAIGFVRAYAEHLGLDGDEIVRRYKDENAGVKRPPRYEYPLPPPESGIPSGALLGIAVALGMVVYGVWYTMADADRRAADVIQEVPARLAALLNSSETPTQETASAATEPEVSPTDETESAAPPAESEPPAAVAPDATMPVAETPTPTTAPAPAPTPTPAPAPVVVAEAPKTAPPVPTAVPTAAPTTAPAPIVAPATVPPAATQPAPTAQPTPPPRASQPTPVAVAPAAQPSTAAQPTPTPPPRAPAQVAQTQAPQPQPQAQTQPQPTVSAPTAAPTAPAAPRPAPAASPPTQTATAAPAVPPAPRPASAAQGAAAAKANVELRAKSDSWIQVRDGEQLLLTRFLRKGETYKVPERQGLTLMTLNAGGIEILVDGQLMPPLGDAGSVARGVSLDAAKLKAAPRPAASTQPAAVPPANADD